MWQRFVVLTPLRTATPDKGPEGMRAYSHLHGLMPRLGFFAGHESRLPVDFAEIMACTAPKHLLVIAPQLDRDAIFSDVQKCVNTCGNVYSLYETSTLDFYSPKDYNPFSDDIKSFIIEWFDSWYNKQKY